ncbi:MAG: imidazoleglycerol-phosphate dehydratase, partial [Actinobacteria bacterium]|nr:imidazoleglycerol-phosphate dehydratase [Actinomycetota bacterium]
MNEALIKRETKETSILLKFKTDGTGKTEINTPLPFFNHMLEAFARHGRFDLFLTASGDVEVDPHHLIEDVGICLGKAVREIYHNRAGISRSGCFAFPMDEALAMVALDLSGRAYLDFDKDAPNERINDFKVSDLKEFFSGFAN